MWKLKYNFYGKRNLVDKYEIMFSILPTIAFTTELYNKKIEYNLHFILFFFGLNIAYYYESD